MRALIGPLVLALLIGCAERLPRDATQGVTVDQVLSGSMIFGSEPLPALSSIDILAVDEAMRAFIDRFVDRRANDHLRLQQLVYAVINDATFGLDYTEYSRTAAETFAAHNGNCLSFTNMFVAMAREVGLDASFQQVDIPPDWEQRGDTLVLNRHINVLVKLGQGERKAVDFNIDDFKTSYDRKEVSDRRAQAHYYNNIGVEKLQAGDFRGAFLSLRKGIATDTGFSPLWTNLGTLYGHAGHQVYAETAYLEALRHDSSDLVAISNLARLYERLGNTARAATFREAAQRHRDQNPYYRFGLAREAFLNKDYQAALKHVDFAISLKKEEDSFHFLRGIVYLQLGDSGRARKDLDRAEALAGNEMLKRNYHSKIEMLLREQ